MGAENERIKKAVIVMQVLDVIQPFHYQAAVKPFDIAGEMDEVGFGQVFHRIPRFQFFVQVGYGQSKSVKWSCSSRLGLPKRVIKNSRFWAKNTFNSTRFMSWWSISIFSLSAYSAAA